MVPKMKMATGNGRAVSSACPSESTFNRSGRTGLYQISHRQESFIDVRMTGQGGVGQVQAADAQRFEESEWFSHVHFKGSPDGGTHAFQHP
jgi:hypothetical protein